MAGDLPEYYFRVRENGAFVFRVDSENRQRRIEMDQIATVNIRNGEIKPQGERQLTQEDVVVIREWMEQRVATLAARDIVVAATKGGADALGLGAELGTIEPGKRALLTVVPFGGDTDPYEHLCAIPDRVLPLAEAGA